MVKKDIVLFGTGKYFENYMECCGQEAGRRPVFAVDNDPDKAGSIKCGIPVYMPDMLRDRNRESFYVVICAARYGEIGKQLEDMGITDYQYYRPLPVESAVPSMLVGGELVSIGRAGTKSVEAETVNTDSMPKPYRIGYVPGVFDLFHIGHLNLLRNAKNRCEYLIAGVLTDELVEHFKNRKPVIPYAQRAAIVNAISYVDRVVPVDFTNTKKIDAWKKYHYDCHFSGNDHGADWARDLEQLREVGSNMEFFEYTAATSTTLIRKQQAMEKGQPAARGGEANVQGAVDGMPGGTTAQKQNVSKKEEETAGETGYKTPDKMKRVWNVELAMLDEIGRICKKHNLRYFLVHGSLLGAVRHRGFIPWDDDLDIAMPRNDYDRFIEFASRELPENLSVHTPITEKDIFWGGYARMRDSRTTAIEPRDMGHQGNLGIWVDILPFDVCTQDDRRFEKKERKICLFQKLISAGIYGRDFRTYMGIKHWKWQLYRLIAKCCGHDRLCRKLDAAQRMYTGEEADQIAFFTGMGKYRRLQASNFEGTEELEFAGRRVPVPVGYEKYLFEIMGRDYMKYPPEEERKPKHRGIYDPEKPYTDYVSLLFDTFADVKGKEIILFGAGLMFEDYMKKYGDKYRPSFLVDNDENKWGRSRMGIPIRRPEDILDVPEKKRKLIICSYYYREISEQLDKIGIHEYKVYVQEMQWILQTEERYKG